MENNPSKTLYLTTAEAIALVKRSTKERARFALSLTAPAYDAKNPEQGFLYGCSTYLNISRKDALHIVSTMLRPPIEQEGGRIRIDKVGPSVFGCITYWIGF